MANPSKNLPATMQLKPVKTETVREEDIEETLEDFEKVESSTVDNTTSMEATDDAVAGTSGSQRQETAEAPQVPALIMFDTSKPKQRRRRKPRKVEYSSDSSSNEESEILARIQATKRAIEEAQKDQPEDGQKKKKM